jgi:hypothetical protein
MNGSISAQRARPTGRRILNSSKAVYRKRQQVAETGYLRLLGKNSQRLSNSLELGSVQTCFGVAHHDATCYVMARAT